jgi:tetrahydromethanopterin S-methyltransferase subunit A
MNLLERFAGKVCEVILPIKHNIFYGNNQSDIAVCTLSSIDLLEGISKSRLMNEVAIAARLFSENRGIEKLIKYAINSNIKHIILCGKDTRGHMPGQALLSLHINGIENGRIVGAIGKDPILDLEEDEVQEFRENVQIIDLIGVTDINKISERVALIRT